MTGTVAKMRIALAKALRAGWQAARQALLTLQNIDSDTLFFPLAGDQHVGDPQHRIDAIVCDVIENSLRATFPTIRVIGEESPRSVRPSDYLVAIVDPVDGTTPYKATGEAWAIAGLILEAKDDRKSLFLPAAAILTSSGILVGVWDESVVTVQRVEAPDDEAIVLYDCAPRLTGPLSLACVGAKKTNRKRLETLWAAFPDATAFNYGGNPVVMGVLTGTLDAIVSFEPQTNWDSLYALPIALAGGTVGGTLEHRIYSVEEVKSWARRPHQGNAKEVKIVPAIVVAKDETTYHEVFRRLNEGRTGN